MKLLFYDIETFKGYFLIKIYNPGSQIWYKFGVNKYENSLDGFLKFIEAHKEHFWVGYNSLRFDSQVVEWIIRNCENWHELHAIEITRKIWQKAQDVIDDANYEIFPEYREYELSIKQLDLLTIWHFNNKNRRTSLKAIEFFLDMENIEELPFDHHKEEFTSEEITTTDRYCDNDIIATYNFYLLTIGRTDNKWYKGENKIEDRQTMQEEFDLPCLNWDDVKIGAEWNKLDYIKLTGRKEKDLKPKKVKHFYGRRFRQFFPKTVKFQTPELKKFVSELGNAFVLSKKQEFRFDFSTITKHIKKEAK